MALIAPAHAAPAEPAAKPAGEPAAPEAAPKKAPADELQEARELHAKGRARYQTFDYDGAIQYWTDALAVLPEDDSTRNIRNDIVWNLSQAQLEAYKQDRKRIRLLRAQELLKVYLQEYERLYGEEVKTSEEAVRVQKRLDDIEGMIVEHDASAPAPADEPPPESPPPAVDRPPDRLARPLTIAGAVSMGVGGALLAVMGVGLGRGAKLQGDGEDADPSETSGGELAEIEDEGKVMNALAIGTGVAGGVLLVAGAALLAVGQVRKRRSTAVVPAVGPTFAGLSWKVTF